MKLSSSTFTAVAFAILSAAATSTNAVLDTAADCAAASTVTVHDVQTVFVTVGGNKAATVNAVTKATTTKAGTTTTTKKAATTTTKAATTTTKAAVTTTTTKAGTKAVTSKAGKQSTTTTAPRATITKAPANNNSGKTNNKGNSNNNKGGNKSKGGKFVTVTRTIKYVKPITKVVTKTKNNQVVVTSTAVTTITSTAIQTVTAEASPTTIVSTTTLDNPITVTATVTEKGQEVVKTTEILTQIVTITSDVVQETQASTITLTGTETIGTESAAATTTDSTATTTTTDSAATTTTDSAAATGTDSAVDIQSLSSTAATASETATATTSAADSGATEDPQTSLTLDSRSIMSSQASDGNPSNGQVASLTSTNNFVNFCLTQNVPITNGQQIKTGSCNPVPMGRILATDRLPSSVFVFPTNFGTIAANTAFTIKMKIKNLKTGNFVNANKNYYSAPAQVDGNGTLVGHSHCVIEPLDSFDQTKPTDPTTFSFFKGLNGVANQDGILTADVTGGLPAGKYRIGSINAAANHQPALASVAQHGTMDAWAYFTVA